MNIKESLIIATKILKDNNIEDGFNIARILMAYTLNKTKEYLIINDKKEIDENLLKRYNEYIEKIKDGYPLQYITNNQEFMKLNFFVNEDVLIPQPDTEILVEEVIKMCNPNNSIKILDLCTGSGAIAISLKKYIENSEITATDISPKALDIARKNAKHNNTDVEFIESDMFNNIEGEFDIIISNPPYIESETIKKLSKDVRNEPIQALDGGTDGLRFYRIIAKEAHKFLNKDGYLALEIGFNQKEEVINILDNERKYTDIKCVKDLANNDRVIIVKKK